MSPHTCLCCTAYLWKREDVELESPCASPVRDEDPCHLHQTPANKRTPHRLAMHASMHAHTHTPHTCARDTVTGARLFIEPRAYPLLDSDLGESVTNDTQHFSRSWAILTMTAGRRGRREKNIAICTGSFLFTHEIAFLCALWIIDSHSQRCAGVSRLNIWDWSTG